MNAVHFLSARDTGSSTMTPTMISLLVALLVLVLIAFACVLALVMLRKVRKQRKESGLPLYEDATRPTSRVSQHHRSLTITAGRRAESIYVYEEKAQFMKEGGSPPASPIPEIRITFPEEVDDQGKRQSGRVVVVRVGEHSVGMEPLHEEDLPPYQKDASDRFHSLDLDRIGGLKEKDDKELS
ncbi:hypothetical protein K490DRAFT_19513, partial [Saccharata proteae CBS 121410]